MKKTSSLQVIVNL